MKARLPQGMGGGAQNMNGMIKQAQKMQAQITSLQEDIENREFTATSGGGAVEVVMSGRKEILRILKCSRILSSAHSMTPFTRSKRPPKRKWALSQAEFPSPVYSKHL